MVANEDTRQSDSKSQISKTCCFFSVAANDHPARDKRSTSYADDPRSYLDQVIAHWIYKIPFLIDESVDVSEKDLRLTVAKRVTQGWSIVLASWKDIYSDFIGNNRTLGDLGTIDVVYNYAFLANYGIGFGFPLLLGLPDDTKDCSSYDFSRTLKEYQLDNGISGLLQQGATTEDVRSILTEFATVIGTKLSCVDNAENLESQVAVNAVSNLVAAFNARLDVEESRYKRTTFQARNLELPTSLDSKAAEVVLSSSV